MRRFGGTDDFLALIGRARALAPDAGFRTNVILGFPGETEDDVAELERFLTEGRLDAVGVFGYSDEEGTEAMGFPASWTRTRSTPASRRITDLVEELTAQRAEDRIGERVEVLLRGPLRRPRVRDLGRARRAPGPRRRRDHDGDRRAGGRRRRRGRRRGGGRHRGCGPGRTRALRAAGPSSPSRAVTVRGRRPDPAATPPQLGAAGQPAQRADRAPAGLGAGVRLPAASADGGHSDDAARYWARWSSRWRSSPTATTA